MTKQSAAQEARKAFLTWQSSKTNANNARMFAALRQWDSACR